MQLKDLHQQIHQSFNLAEIQALCFTLNIDYEDLAGETKRKKIWSLLDYCGRNKLFVALTTYLREQRPNQTWLEVELGRVNVVDSRPDDEMILIERVETQWIEQKLLVEAPPEHRLTIDKRFNNKHYTASLGDILEHDTAAVILGQTGSGKTIVLCEFVQTLLQQALQDRAQPLPVMLSASSWRPVPEQDNVGHFSNWLVAKLHLTYGMGTKLGRKWLEDGKLFLLLDGLDQIQARHLPSFIQTLNAFYQESGFKNVIVACQTDAYRELTTPLASPNEIELLPLDYGLSSAQYAAKTSQTLAKLDEDELASAHLNSLLLAKESLVQALETPLMLNMFRQLYTDDPQALASLDLASPAAWRQYITTTFIDRQFEEGQAGGTSELRPQAQNVSQQVKTSLIWLATKMAGERFYVEQIQPDWLAPTQQNRYRLLAIFITTLIAGLPVGITLGFSYAQGIPVPNGLMAGLAFGLILGLGGSLAYYVLPDNWLASVGLGVACLTAVSVSMWLAWRSNGGILVGALMGVGATILAQLTGALKHKAQIVTDAYTFSWRAASIRAVPVLVLGLLLSWVLDIAFPSGEIFEFLSTVSLFGSLIVFAYGYKRKVNWQQILKPNEGIKRTLNNALLSSVIFLAISWVAFLLLTTLIGAGGVLSYSYGQFGFYVGGPISALAIGTFVGMVIFLTNGGLAVIKHYVVLFLLQQSNQIPTINYADYLDSVVRISGIMNKIGAGYEFKSGLKRYFALSNFRKEF